MTPRTNNDLIYSLVAMAAIALLLIYNFTSPFMSDINQAPTHRAMRKDRLILTDAEWVKKLSPEQYKIMRLNATEPAFSGKYYNFVEKGTYACAACALPLFSSTDKLESKSGWPTFSKPLADDVVWYRDDTTLQQRRIEVLCNRCDSHLGNVVNDKGSPTGKHYVINSIALNFIPQTAQGK